MDMVDRPWLQTCIEMQQFQMDGMLILSGAAGSDIQMHCKGSAVHVHFRPALQETSCRHSADLGLGLVC